jgi:hypothetical protein
MNKVRVLILAMLAFALTACMSTPAGPAKPKGPNLTGEWVLTTESPMGSQDTQMVVTQTGDAIAGKITGERGTVPYTGKLTGNDVTWGFDVNAQGMELRIDYAGVVEGDTIKGKATFGQFGEGNFSAKRKM